MTFCRQSGMGSMFEGGTWAGIEKKCFDGNTKQRDNVIGELVGFVLWEEGLFSDEIAGEKVKVFVSEGNVDAFDLLVLGCHDGCLMSGKKVWICS